MDIKWVSPDEVPAESQRSAYYYKRFADRLRKSPNNWAVWNERCDGARFYEARKRHPDIEFRRQKLETTTSQPRYKVFARYVPN